MTLAAQVWHYWIAVPLVASAFGLVVATIVGYFVKVSRMRYPRQ